MSSKLATSLISGKRQPPSHADELRFLNSRTAKKYLRRMYRSLNGKNQLERKVNPNRLSYAELSELKKSVGDGDLYDMLSNSNHGVVTQPSFVMHRRGNTRAAWDCALLLCIVFSCGYGCFSVAYEEDFSPALIICDIIFMLAVWMNMHTTIVGSCRNERENCDLAIMKKSYLNSWFFIDILGAIPVAFLQVVLKDVDGIEDLAGLFLAVRLARSAHLR